MTDKLREALENIRSLVEETWGLASTSPRGKENLTEVLNLLDLLCAPSAGPVAKGALPEFPPFPIWVEANDAEALHAWASQVRREAYEVGAAAGRSAESVGGFELTRSAPIDMVLHCPKCGMQHIDEPEAFNPDRHNETTFPAGAWTNPPHRSHLCHRCNYIWRPADVPTNGVAAVKTKGKNDFPPVAATGEPAPDLAGALDSVLQAWWSGRLIPIDERSSGYVNGVMQRAERAQCAAAPAAGLTASEPVNDSKTERLKHAVEGECDGLALTDAQAIAILRYVLPTTPIAVWDDEQAAAPSVEAEPVRRLVGAAMAVISRHDEWVRQMPAGAFDDPLSVSLAALHDAAETVGISMDIVRRGKQ